MAKVLRDRGLYRFIGGNPPTVAELRRQYAAWSAGPSSPGESWLNWVIRTTDGTAVGHAQATVTGAGAVADVAWVVGAPWQGRGYASEAARALIEWLVAQGVRDVTAHVHAENRASGRVAEQAGLARTTEIDGGEVVWRLRPPGSGSTPGG